jgi:hypothetical protein
MPAMAIYRPELKAARVVGAGRIFKESNRSQARHIAVKLTEVECQIVRLRDWGAIDFTFTNEEVEKLAEVEHAWWWNERRTDGWSLG